ncbi:MAG: aldolase/citrate lyase family protein [Candidatus Latescibacteria bacterium]|jgi:4-hydroxy-2-oxoheptanedioate aldolase|nr:aldolase/citrate lyase family protein [Candidatus Latescibacterota bacterium]
MADKTLKQRIREGEIVHSVGVPMDIERGHLEDILGQHDCDYLNVDAQHGPFNEAQLVAFCAMAKDLDLPVQIRIKHTRHAYLIGNYLDLGPSGVMVPEVENEAVVDEALNAFYYPQVGKRSWGGTLRIGLDERPDRLEYAPWWNDYGWLAIQIESVEAVINAGKLAKPGVDVFSFGPNDLLFSIEAHPKFPFRTLEDCAKHVLDQVKDTHVKVGMGVGAETPEDREMYMNLGVTVFGQRIGI